MRIYEIAIVSPKSPRARTRLCLTRAVIAADEAQAIRFAETQFAMEGDTLTVQDSYPIYEGSTFPLGSRMIPA